MRRSILSILLSFAFVTTPAIAASQLVDAAVRALDAIEADSEKLEPMCAILKEMVTLSEADAAKAEELDAKMETYLLSIGQEQLDAWLLVEELESGTADAEALEAAFTRIETKCLD